MSYIGSTPTTQSFIAGTDYFNGTGSQVAFTLSRSVNSVNDIEVIVNNVEQIPSGYLVSGTTLTFSAAPSAGTSNVYVRYLSTTNLSLAIPAGTSASFNTVGVSGNLAFTGTGNRITGDFSNATLANRLMFQTATAGAGTSVTAIPNATGDNSAYNIFSSPDVANSSFGQFRVGAGTGDVRITSGITGTGTYLPMTFYIGGSERVRIDTSGNVGIGMTPTNFGNGYTVLQVANASNGGMLYLTNTANAGGRIFGNGAGLTYDAFSTTYHAFNTNGTERARIDAGGNLLVGTTSGAAAQVVVASTTTQNVMRWRNYDNVGRGVLIENSSGTGVGSITWNASTTTYATSSDYRLKEVIAPMTGALAKVALLKPVTYKWKVDGSDGQGFIAHELAEVEAGCVTGEKDAVDADGNPQYQGIDTSFLVATLAAAIQELKAIVDAQGAEIAALKGTP